MVQNFKNLLLGNNFVFTLFEAPTTLKRIFFGIYIIAKKDPSFQVNVSFDNPQFLNPVSLTYCRGYYEFTGPDISQGGIFAKKINFADGNICATEILK